MPLISRQRFWTLYGLLWLPFGVLLTLFLSVWTDQSLLVTGHTGLRNTLAAAILGVGVFWTCRRFSWPDSCQPVFLISQFALGGTYSGLLLMGTASLYQLEARLGWVAPAPFRFEARYAAWQLLVGFLLYAVLASVGYTIQTKNRLEEQRARADAAEAMRSAAELSELRAKLNPHFLFNVLHSLLALIRRDRDEAERALEQFGDMLRYALQVQRDHRDEVRLEEEWGFVQTYLALERLRLGNRLRVHPVIDPESLDCRVPTFCLQPLVENAIIHAIAPRTDGGTVSIVTRLENRSLVLSVVDDGPGADAKDLHGAQGMGLGLVRQRLETLYGNQLGFEVESRPGEGFAVHLRLPTDRHAWMKEEAS